VAATPTVDVIGLRALARDIKRAGDIASPLNDVLKEAGRQAAAPVAAATQGALPTVDTSQHSAGAMAGTVRVGAARTGAAVRMGTAALPYAGPLDFGWRGRAYLANGRYLFPAARSLATDSANLYTEALQRGFDTYPWTNETAQAEAVHD
jgi:hypothetical protein